MMEVYAVYHCALATVNGRRLNVRGACSASDDESIRVWGLKNLCCVGTLQVVCT